MSDPFCRVSYISLEQKKASPEIVLFDMLPSPVINIKAFVPAKDHALSKAFYTDLGFTVNCSNDEIAELQLGSFRFLLQKFYVEQRG